LEKLSFECCESLTAIDDSVGFMTKLKLLSSQHCKKLRRFPPLNLPSLKKLKLSYCSSLENFPEILGKMGNIRRLRLYELTIKELPVSFQNLTGLQELYMECDVDELNSSVLTPELADFGVKKCKEWKWINSKDGEEVDTTVSSNLRGFWLPSCNLNDDFFSAGFTQLTNVRYLCVMKVQQENELEILKIKPMKLGHVDESRGGKGNNKITRSRKESVWMKDYVT